MDATSTNPIPPSTPGAFGRSMTPEQRAGVVANPSRKALRNRHRTERINGITRLSFRRWLAVRS